ncbi:hypothetical protein SDC9_138518 [bioreactor metagenome]|uniref:Neutral/alkaline non-lysosomal ceramidase N-terminal domain-containing protein n=1 Tax=bioreactor metagenome TaxID=1076179 RepID=A0A645DPH4_9ZZZZ
MISSSHTHSGPWAAGRLDVESLEQGKEENPAYIHFLIDTIVSVLANAKKSAFPAEFTSCLAMCGADSGVGGNRRTPGGPHDPLVSVLAVRDAERTVRGIFVNYTLHPTFIHEWSTLVTADYPCYLRAELTERETRAVIGFSQGASGNQSSRYYRIGESYDEAERVGRAIGKAAYTALERAVWTNDLPIAIRRNEVPFELRSFGSLEELERRVEEDTARYRELYAKYGQSKNREEYYLWQNANLKALGSEDQLAYVKLHANGIRISLEADENPAEVQVILLGDTCIVGVPGEVFVEYALYVKAMAGYGKVIFNTLTNGCLPGYLYTPESLVSGGYETDTSMLGEGFGKHLVDAILDTIH